MTIDADILKEVLSEGGVTLTDAQAAAAAQRTDTRADFRRMALSIYNNLRNLDIWTALNSASLSNPEAKRTWIQARITEIKTAFPTFPTYTPKTTAQILADAG